MALLAVLCEPGDCECFEKATAIQLTNLFPILYAHLTSYHRQGALEVLGTLDGSFPERIKAAICECPTIEKKKKLTLLALIEGQRV